MKTRYIIISVTLFVIAMLVMRDYGESHKYTPRIRKLITLRDSLRWAGKDSVSIKKNVAFSFKLQDSITKLLNNEQ